MPTKKKAAPKKRTHTLLIPKLDPEAVTAINQAKRYWDYNTNTKAANRLITGYWSLQERLEQTIDQLADLQRTYESLVRALEQEKRAKTTIDEILERPEA